MTSYNFHVETSTSQEEKSHTAVSGELRETGRDEDSDVEIDLESVEEADHLNSSDDKGDGQYSIIKRN